MKGEEVLYAPQFPLHILEEECLAFGKGRYFLRRLLFSRLLVNIDTVKQTEYGLLKMLGINNIAPNDSVKVSRCRGDNKAMFSARFFINLYVKLGACKKSFVF